VIVENDLFFPFLEPPIARNQIVVLIDLAVTLFPVVKLAGAQAKPLEKLTRRELRPVRPAVDVVDDFITCVMGNPGSVQGPPSSFFSCTCSCISSAITSFFSTSLLWSRATSLALPEVAWHGVVVQPGAPNQLGFVEHLLDPGVDLAWLDAEFISEVGNRFLAAEMAADDLSLLRHREMPT
jgi:hypothetical protein